MPDAAATRRVIDRSIEGDPVRVTISDNNNGGVLGPFDARLFRQRPITTTVTTSSPAGPVGHSLGWSIVLPATAALADSPANPRYTFTVPNVGTFRVRSVEPIVAHGVRVGTVARLEKQLGA